MKLAFSRPTAGSAEQRRLFLGYRAAGFDGLQFAAVTLALHHHLKDFADGEFRVLGEGEIDFDPVFQALREIGYDGWLGADEESGSDLEAGMAAAYRFLQRRRDEAIV